MRPSLPVLHGEVAGGGGSSKGYMIEVDLGSGDRPTPFPLVKNGGGETPIIT